MAGVSGCCSGLRPGYEVHVCFTEYWVSFRACMKAADNWYFAEKASSLSRLKVM